MTLSSVADTETVPVHLRRIHDLASNIVKLLDLAWREVDRDQPAAKASIARATSLLQVEIRHQEAASDPELPGGMFAKWQIRSLRAYIDDHLDRPITVKELSGIAKRSPSHFCHTFKRTFGETPHAYVINRRIARAGELMLETDALLVEIAYSCGFADQAHLSRLFRRHTGQAPSVWRRERREAAVRPPMERDILLDRAFPREASRPSLYLID